MDLTRFDTMLAEGRVIRGKYVDTAPDGRELACWIAALSPEAAAEESAEACPATTLWPWLARLTPWLDDAGSPDPARWKAKTLRYAGLLHKIADLPEWQRAVIGPLLDFRVRALCVREAMRHTSDTKVLAVCETVAVLCERAGRGDKAPPKDWAAARWAAARWAAAAEAAEAEAEAEAARWAAAAAAAEAAEAAEAADRLINSTFDAIDSACEKAAA